MRILSCSLQVDCARSSEEDGILVMSDAGRKDMTSIGCVLTFKVKQETDHQGPTQFSGATRSNTNNFHIPDNVKEDRDVFESRERLNILKKPIGANNHSCGKVVRSSAVASLSCKANRNSSTFMQTQGGEENIVYRVGYSKGKSSRPHKRTVVSDRLYRCEACDASFNKRCDAIKHQRTHTRERPFRCEVCNATFSQTSNLYTHMHRKHVGDHSFKCSVCDEAFQTIGNLEKHKGNHIV